MDIKVIAHPDSEHLGQFKEAVREANLLQPYFHFRVEPLRWQPISLYPKEIVDWKLRDLIRQKEKQQVIAIVDFTLDPDLLVAEFRGVSIVSTASWNEEYAPPPLKYHLLHQFASAATNFVAGLSDEMIDGWAHRKPHGCIFDWYEDATELRRTMIAGTICSEHRGKLRQMGVQDPAIEAIESILEAVRAPSIERARSIPTSIFVGHGHSNDAESVISWLESLGLAVEEFNVKPAVAYANVERLKEMLDRAAAAIMILVGEIQYPDGTFHGRENVVHEIGLLQGRVGFNRVAILRDSKAVGFSNIEGVNVVEFESGNFANSQPAKKRLREFLERERLLDPKPLRPAKGKANK